MGRRSTTARDDSVARAVWEVIDRLGWAAAGPISADDLDVVEVGPRDNVSIRVVGGRTVVRLRRGWLDRVHANGVACCPKKKLLTLDAAESPLERPPGADRCFRVTMAWLIWGSGGGTWFAIERDWFAVTLAGVPGFARYPLTALAEAIVEWEKILGVQHGQPDQGRG